MVVVAVSTRRRPAQGALFGPQEPIPAPPHPARVPRPVVNDMDLIEAVIAVARDPGYVLIGATERVYRRVPDGPGEAERVERVPVYEDAAVHQLITGHHLTIGGSHHVHYGRYEGRANSVLVPRTTARTANRWRSYQRPASWGGSP